MDLLRGLVLVLTSFILQDRTAAVGQTLLSDSLYNDLFANYSSSLIPICTVGGNVSVTMDLALRQVMDLNEREQILTINVWLRLKWNDCRLTWDPTSYNNLTNLMVTYSDVWTPDITLYDNAAEETMFPGREDYRASITNAGVVSYNFPTIVTAVCRVNVRFFPFDTQSCSLQFGSWSHHGFDLDLFSKNPQGDISVFVKNSEWIVENIPAQRNVFYYSCCAEPYPDVTFSIVLDRRPAFYLMTMLFPCILVSCVAALVFLLPVESGEKVSLEITVLLSLAVFLLLVSETLPPASDNFPIIGSYFASSMALVSLSLFQTVSVLNIYYRGTDGRKVPRWLRIVFFQYLGRVVCGKHTKVTAVDSKCSISEMGGVTIGKGRLSRDPSPNRDHVENNHHSHKDVEPGNGKHHSSSLPALPFRDPIMRVLGEQTQSLRCMERTYRDREADEENQGDWRDIANIMDRLFLILYLLVTIITTLAFLMQCV